MPRIVSGWQPPEQFDSGAVLRGYEKGAKFRLAQQANDRQNAALQMELMQALTRMQQMKAQALQQAQQSANMGDAQAMQSLAMAAKSGALDPQQSMLDSMNEMLMRTTDPAARSLLVNSIDSVTQSLKTTKERATVEEAIKRAGANGWADEQMMTDRLNTGEPPLKLLQELQQIEAQVTADSVASGEAADVLTQADALISSTPPGPKRRSAEIRRKHYELDQYGQKKPGSAQTFLQGLQGDLLSPLQTFQGGGLGTKQGIGYSTDFAEAPKTPEEIADALLSSGKPVTEEDLAALMKELGGGGK